MEGHGTACEIVLKEKTDSSQASIVYRTNMLNATMAMQSVKYKLQEIIQDK